MDCPDCKAALVGNPRYCPKCGSKLGVLAQAPKGRSPPEPPMSDPIVHLADEKTIICPICGTANPSAARFCKKDGKPLQSLPLASSPENPIATASVSLEAEQTEDENVPLKRAAHTPSVMPHVIGVVALVAIAAGGGGYLWWTGHVAADRQDSIAQEINTQLHRHGIGNVKVDVNQEWIAIAEGVVASQAEKNQVLSVVKPHKELSGIDDRIRIKPVPGDLENRINKVLADAGIGQVTAQVDEGGTTVTLNDWSLGPDERDKAEKLANSVMTDMTGAAAATIAHAAPTPSPPGMDIASTERELNEGLRAAGLDQVKAHVEADGTVKLHGTVANRKDRDRAMRLALAQTGATSVDDFIRITPPPRPIASAPAASSISPQATVTTGRQASPVPEVLPPAKSRDPVAMEGDINRALRNGGMGSISARIGDDLSITLSGSTTSSATKEEAFRIARKLGHGGNIKDRVFVVE